MTYDRTFTFRRLSPDDQKVFREKGRIEAAETAKWLQGRTFTIDFWTHPEYRIGALEALLEHARMEAAKVAQKPYDQEVDELWLDGAGS